MLNKSALEHPRRKFTVEDGNPWPRFGITLLGYPIFAHIDIHQSTLHSGAMFSDQILDRNLHAIADPARRRILEALKERGACSIDKETGLCASDIEARLNLSQPTISHHMGILTRAGLVEARKIGQWRWYQRNENALANLVRSLKATL